MQPNTLNTKNFLLSELPHVLHLGEDSGSLLLMSLAGGGFGFPAASYPNFHSSAIHIPLLMF